MKLLTIALLTALLLVAACGKSDESMSKKVGKKVGGVVVDFGSGVGQGADEKMLANVDLGPEATKAGLSVTTAKGLGLDQKGITVYLLAKTAAKGTLLAKALNKKGDEIGRSVAAADFAADDGKYVSFPFEKELDTQLVEKYLIELKP